MFENFGMLMAAGPGRVGERAGSANVAAAVVEASAVKVATYNIHTCIGVDGRYDPGRVGAVLRQIDADIACLQEVETRRRGDRHPDQWAYLGEVTGRRVVIGTGTGEHLGRFGNAILTRYAVLGARAIDLTVAGYEPRGAIDADLLIGDRVLRVIATHFGLHAIERRLQANRLMAMLAEPPAPNRQAANAILLMGDLNEWRGRSGAIRLFDRRLGPSAAARTFPSWLPVLALDRIYAEGPAVLCDVRVFRSSLARLASDHLPLVGDLCWTALDQRRHTTPHLARHRREPSVSRWVGSRIIGRRVASPATPV